MGNLVDIFNAQPYQPELMNSISELQLSQLEIESKMLESKHKLDLLETEIQTEMIQYARDNFDDVIKNAINDNKESIMLEFPYGLSHEHKITLIKELLLRFGKIQIKTIGTHQITQIINISSNIPLNVKYIIIKIMKSD
jgi:hypothetical protein